MKQTAKQEHIRQLFEIITNLENIDDCRALFDDLCTVKELENMAERCFAAKLLLEGKSVTEVCGSSGFPDCSRFISVFKNKFGQTPLQYQKHHEG